MRNRSDQFAKRIGQESWTTFGSPAMNDAINPETQYADLRYEPDPARTAGRDQAGLIGRLAAAPCIIEFYSDAPSAEEFRACLSKHLAVWQQRGRKLRSDQRKYGAPLADFDPNSLLWIITARAPKALLTKLHLEPAPDWPSGVYFFGGDVLRVGLIVACELPRDPSTLLVRLMAAGPLLAPAVKEVEALPPNAYARAIAVPILLDFKQLLDESSSLTPDEEEFLVAIHKTWAEERAAARTEGRTEGLVEALLAILRVRGIAVPPATLERIQAEKNEEQLRRWSEKAAVASSINDVLG